MSRQVALSEGLAGAGLAFDPRAGLIALLRGNDFMNGFLLRLACVIAFLSQAPCSRGDGLIAPLSWSSDSRWLCYTALDDPAQAIQSTESLFGRTRERLEGVRSAAVTRQDPAAPVVYRIWAADQTGRTTVLIEESRWPLSAPAWGPRGRLLAFSRFIPQSGEPAGPTQPGRLDLVVQRGSRRNPSCGLLPNS